MSRRLFIIQRAWPFKFKWTHAEPYISKYTALGPRRFAASPLVFYVVAWKVRLTETCS